MRDVESALSAHGEIRGDDGCVRGFTCGGCLASTTHTARSRSFREQLRAPLVQVRQNLAHELRRGTVCRRDQRHMHDGRRLDDRYAHEPCAESMRPQQKNGQYRVAIAAQYEFESGYD